MKLQAEERNIEKQAEKIKQREERERQQKLN
jgi:hypothetical protein